MQIFLNSNFDILKTLIIHYISYRFKTEIWSHFEFFSCFCSTFPIIQALHPQFYLCFKYSVILYFVAFIIFFCEKIYLFYLLFNYVPWYCCEILNIFKYSKMVEKYRRICTTSKTTNHDILSGCQRTKMAIKHFCRNIFFIIQISNVLIIIFHHTNILWISNLFMEED